MTNGADPASHGVDLAGSDLDGLVLGGVVLVTGTGTGVGKTTVTAALAARALAAGRRVRVIKPVQTGVGPGAPGDAAEVCRLLAPGRPGTQPWFAPELLEVHELSRLPEALAPQAAARLAGVRLTPLAQHAKRIAELAAGVDLVLVEGAGGVLVRLDGDGAEGGTMIDLAVQIATQVAVPVGVVVVTGPELGTLNVTELTVLALRRRDVRVLGLVLGRWPADPGVAERANLRDLPELTGVPLLGAVPQAPPLPPPLRPVR